LFEHLGGDIHRVGVVYDIENGTTSAIFEGYRAQLYQQQVTAPEQFRREDHKDAEDWELKQKYEEDLERRITMADLQPEENKMRVLPVAHGTSEAAAWKISFGGLGVVAKVDAGFYGQGIYLSSEVSYVEQFSTPAFPENSAVLVVGLAIPGNAYPATEDPFSPKSLLGANRKLGYQSHYVVVNSRK